jgi:hypothetical protein
MRLGPENTRDLCCFGVCVPMADPQFCSMPASKLCAESIRCFEKVRKAVYCRKLCSGVKDNADPRFAWKRTVGKFTPTFVSCGSSHCRSFPFN